MPLAYRYLPLCAALLLAACGDNGTSTNAGPDTTTGDSSTTVTPTGTSTTEPTTGGSTTTATTGGSTGAMTTDDSTTGVNPADCSQIMDQNTCDLSPNCKWGKVVGYTHGTQGCLGNIKDFCIPKKTDPETSAFWKDNNGDIEVVQFGFVPDDLGPEWKACDCDGPLACLCTALPLDCPDRLLDFCGGITGENGCAQTQAAGKPVCGWFPIRDTGPADGLCGNKPQNSSCLPATDADLNTCTEASLPPYDACVAQQPPIFWRDNNGVIEVTKKCGPKPIGWTQCLPNDPNQPEECKCLCL